jgi:hypothetical protein
VNDPENDLRQFLAEQPSWRRKVLQLDFSLTADEISAWGQCDWERDYLAYLEQYECFIRRSPAQWREHREKLTRIAVSSVPSGKPGRPRKDADARQYRKLRGEGKSYKEIAIACLGTSIQGLSREAKVARVRSEAERIRKLLTRPRESSRGPDRI